MPTQQYADIILPLAIDAPAYTYGIPEELAERVVPGVRVIVSLGRKKYYSGVVYRVHDERPEAKRLKQIESVVDTAPVVTGEQLRLWEWIASYYMSSLGMVMRAALPTGLKMDGRSHEEALRDGYAARKISYVRLHGSIRSEADLNAALDSLKRAKVQYKAIMEYLDRTGGPDFSAPEAKTQAISKNSLNASPAIIKALADKNIFAVSEEEAPGDTAAYEIGRLPELTAAQSKALDEIEKSFVGKGSALLHGVTGSGKTETYIRLIAKELNAGNNVLYMLPEIALTAQLIDRLQDYFGDRVVVCHSRISNNKRTAVYLRLLGANDSAEKGLLIVGVRSAVLLPTPKLSLIVIDEEHDQSFKQSDTSPRYHARDTAAVLAEIYEAKLLLGSATPSVETYFNAASGKKYGMVTLTERYGDGMLPQVIISDTLRAAKRGEKVSHFNRILLDHMDKALQEGRQVILFQNRRGFSPYVECGTCGWTAHCPQCNVTLTYHKSDESLRCHYCGYSTNGPRICPSCKAEDIVPRGFGTEKIEEELFPIFPGAQIERLDSDTARSTKNYTRIVGAFGRGEADILVGTQMITKGFDFGNVSLVGILNADNMLNYPDFRAAERAFQLMVQVAGRAGRRDDQGTVIIQTAQPAHPVLRYVLAYDYDSFVRAQLAERISFNYPPYCRLVSISMYHRDHALLWRGARHFAALGSKVFGRRLLGPEPPPVDKIKGEYIVRFMLKIERGKSVSRAKELLEQLIRETTAQEEFRHIGIMVDVDPQ